MARIHFVVFLLGALLSLAAASSPQIFCKCTCFKNSTIIPLGPQHKDNQLRARSLPRSTLPLYRNLPEAAPFLPAREARADDEHEDVTVERRSESAPKLEKRVPSACSSCTKVFCREHNLPFCHDAEDEDMQTMCFQRDSSKDQFIVWGFILGTFGLLGWAAFKKVMEIRQRRVGAGPGGVGVGGGYARVGASG